MYDINAPHDKFFRSSLHNVKIARSFFNKFLPEEVKKHIDLEHLRLTKVNFVSDLNKNAIADVVYETKYDNQVCYLYLLIEHQSSSDPLMAFRIFQYTCHIMQQYLESHHTNRLPLVYPIVLYHGTSTFTGARDIRDLVDAPTELVEKYCFQPFQLIDVNKIDESTIKDDPLMAGLINSLKYIFIKDTEELLKKMVETFNTLVGHDEITYLEMIFQYVYTVTQVKNEKQFYHLVEKYMPEKVGETGMTIAEVLHESGFEKGLQAGLDQGLKQGLEQGLEQGREENLITIIRNLLDDNCEMTLIESATRLSRKQINSLMKRYQHKEKQSEEV